MTPQFFFSHIILQFVSLPPLKVVFTPAHARPPTVYQNYYWGVRTRSRPQELLLQTWALSPDLLATVCPGRPLPAGVQEEASKCNLFAFCYCEDERDAYPGTSTRDFFF